MAITQTISEMDIINDDIFKLLGFTNISDEQKREMITLILQIVQNRIIARLYDVFESAERDMIEDLFSKKDYDTVNGMLSQKNLPDIVTLVAQEVMLYKAELVQKFNPPSAT